MSEAYLSLFRRSGELKFSAVPFSSTQSLYSLCLFAFSIIFNAFSIPVSFFKLQFVHLFVLLIFYDPFWRANEKVKCRFYWLNSKNIPKFCHRFLWKTVQLRSPLRNLLFATSELLFEEYSQYPIFEHFLFILLNLLFSISNWVTLWHLFQF